jgi:hypothetical protein
LLSHVPGVCAAAKPIENVVSNIASSNRVIVSSSVVLATKLRFAEASQAQT